MNRILLFVLALSFGGCVYDAPGTLVCNTEGERSGDRVCQDGLWVTDGPGTSDMDQMEDGGDPGDMDGPDIPTPEDMAPDAPLDMEPDACVPETTQETCDRQGAGCGMITASNNCGTEVMVDCGGCAAPLGCGLAGVPNVCSCVGSDDAQICMSESAECGTIMALDPACGVMRSVSCGGCTAPESCGGDDVPNECGCKAESEAEFCARLGVTCGSTTAQDNCGTEQTYQCGSCPGPVLSCGGGGEAGQCGCNETTICDQLGLECGSADVSTQCPNLVQAVQCGGCGQGTCSPSNTCVCNPGYRNANGNCVDINECNANSDDCDANATCTNTPGSFSCACNPGFTGDGKSCAPSVPTITHTVQASMSASDDMSTPSIAGSSTTTLYVAFVSVRTEGNFVNDVSGLGLNWTRLARQCNRGGTEHLDLWAARGNASAGAVRFQTNNVPFAAAATVMRIEGAASTALSVTTQNANGTGCGGGGPDGSYSYDASQVATNSLMLAATSTLGATHTAGTGWTPQIDLQAANGSDVTRHFVMRRTTTGSNNFAVAGSFGANTRWASVNVTIDGP